jgi:hypothetical protein
MIDRRPYDLDMRSDGSFVERPRQDDFAGWSPPPRGGKIARNLTIAAALVGAVIVAGLALSVALVLVPVMIGVALIGYGALRFQLWRMRRGGAPMPGAFGPIMAQMEAILRARRQGR